MTLSKNELLNYRDRDLSLMIDKQRKLDASYYYEKCKNSLISRPCPVCGDSSFNLIDRYNESFPIVRCCSCLTIYVNETLGINDLSEYYESSKSCLLLNEFYKNRNLVSINPVSDYRLLGAIKTISNLNKPKVRILEVGCGDGSFLIKLKKELAQLQIYAEIYGIDTNAEELSSAASRGVHVNKIFADTLYNIYSCDLKFDGIFFFELIEHLIFPFEFINSLHSVSAEKCVYTFSTPNSMGLENKITDYNGYRLLAHSIAPPAHINAFNVSNITHLLLRAGFFIDDIETHGRFDAWAAVDYLQNAPEHELKTHCIKFIKNDNASDVQELINFLGASSTMRVIFKNFK